MKAPSPNHWPTRDLPHPPLRLCCFQVRGGGGRPCPAGAQSAQVNQSDAKQLSKPGSLSPPPPRPRLLPSMAAAPLSSSLSKAPGAPSNPSTPRPRRQAGPERLARENPGLQFLARSCPDPAGCGPGQEAGRLAREPPGGQILNSSGHCRCPAVPMAVRGQLHTEGPAGVQSWWWKGPSLSPRTALWGGEDGQASTAPR